VVLENVKNQLINNLQLNLNFVAADETIIIFCITFMSNYIALSGVGLKRSIQQDIGGAVKSLHKLLTLLRVETLVHWVRRGI
jgi:hypothetical protein